MSDDSIERLLKIIRIQFILIIIFACASFVGAAARIIELVLK